MNAAQPKSTQTTSARSDSWRVLRSDKETRGRREIYRRWRTVCMRSADGMVLFGLLFFAVWLSISMLMPQDHLFAGIVLLSILIAESVCVILHLVSDYMLQILRHRR